MKLFGTFSGVFVPSFEALFGSVLFLILPMLVGDLGLSQMLLIVVLANTVTIATAFSIGDCASNLERIGAGGMYAVAKRSLGKAFGGSIGIQLFVAQAASIGFYAISFALPLREILGSVPLFADFFVQNNIGTTMQTQIIATIIAVIAFVAGLIGADFVSKIQMLIFVILSVSVGSILITPFLGIESGGAPVFLGDFNMGGASIVKLGFWAAFTMFFPAVTGIDAGVGMSGNLKNPRKSLAKGTFLAIAVTGVGYILVTVIFSMIRPELLVDASGNAQSVFSIFRGNWIIKTLLLMGILFATGSSALAYFLTSPRTVQALAKDNILPRFLSFLGKDFKRGGREPRWGTVMTFLIVIPVIWAGDIEFASMIVGICFLVVYGWVNLAAFFERISGNPSFRPTTKNHWLISLYGFLFSMVVIALFNPWIGIGVFLSQSLIFILLLVFKSHNKLEGVWWGLYFNSLTKGLKRIRKIIQGTKNWRPIIGIFGFRDQEIECRNAMSIGKKIADYKGIVLPNILSTGKDDDIDAPTGQIVKVNGDNFDTAILSIAQAAVPGQLNMNTVLLPLDNRVNLISLIEGLMAMGKHVLLYKSGLQSSNDDRPIDVWWKGEENGNLMALLSYIIVQSDLAEKKPKREIRLIRKLFQSENEDRARQEMADLMTSARLQGEILILPEDDKDIHTSIKETSGESSLILIGMPGNTSPGITRLFSLSKIFFSKELKKYEKDFPPILFVKAADKVNLLE